MSGVLGSIGNTLFGSSQNAQQTGSTTPTFASQGQSDLFNQLTQLLSGQLGQGVPTYTGQTGQSTAAGTQPLQNLSYDMIQQLLGQYPGGASSIPQTSQAGGVLSNILNTGLASNVSQAPTYAQGAGTLDTLLQNWDPKSATQMWQSTYVNPALDTWKKDVAPAINEQFIGMNAERSQADPDALAKSLGTVQTNLQGQLANILYSGQQANLQQQQTGVNQALQYAELPLSLSQNAANLQAQGVTQAGQYGTNILDSIMQEIGTGLSGGSTQYGVAQNQATAGYQNWLSGQGYSNPYLSYLQQALGNTYGAQPIVQGPQTTPGLLSSILPGLSTGLGLGMGSNLAGSGSSLSALLNSLMGSSGGSSPLSLLTPQSALTTQAGGPFSVLSDLALAP